AMVEGLSASGIGATSRTRRRAGLRPAVVRARPRAAAVRPRPRLAAVRARPRPAVVRDPPRPAVVRDPPRPAAVRDSPREAAGFALRAVADPRFRFVMSLSEAPAARLVAVAALPTGMPRGSQLHLPEPPLLELTLPRRLALGEPGELLVDLDAVVAGVLVYRP